MCQINADTLNVLYRYKEVSQLQHSYYSLPTATIPVVTPHIAIVWQTKCDLMMCINRVLGVFTILCVHTKITCNSD